MYLMCLEFKDFKDKYGILSKDYFKDSDSKECSDFIKKFNPSIRIVDYNDSNDYENKVSLHDRVFSPSYSLDKHIQNLIMSFDAGKGNGYFFYSNESLIGSMDAEIFNDFIYIVNFGILEEFRGKGLGRCFMVNALCDIINNFENRFDRIYLLVSKKKDNVRFLYESLGFQIKN